MTDSPKEPSDKSGQEAQVPPLTDDAASDMVSWAKTIDRWASEGEQCFLVTKDGLRSATSEDVSDAMDRLRKRRPGDPD